MENGARETDAPFFMTEFFDLYFYVPAGYQTESNTGKNTLRLFFMCVFSYVSGTLSFYAPCTQPAFYFFLTWIVV